MSFLRFVALRLRSLLGRPSLERDMQAEMRQHMHRATQRLIARCLPPAEARLAARREFGNATVIQEDARDVRGMRWIDDLRADLRFAVRYFARNKVTSAIIIAVLALGIGANTVIFGALQAEFTRPAPAMPDDNRLVRLWTTQRDSTVAPWRERDIAYTEVEELAQHGDVFQSVAAWMSHAVLFAGPDSAGPRAVNAQFVTSNYFATIGVAVAGPGFLRDADQSRATHTAVVSYDAAERLYGTPAAAVGKQVLVNNVPVSIVGVAPERFQGARRNSGRPSVWLLLGARADIDRVDPRWLREEHTFEVVARMAPAATHEQATAVAREVTRRLLPDSAARVGLARDALVLDLEAIPPGPGYLETVLTVTAIGLIGLLILLVTCTNVSSLMVAAATARRHEIAVRLSLGASRLRIMRQLLTEATLLTLAGGAAGILLTWWGYTWLDRSRYVQGVDVRPDFATVAFMLGLAMATGILFGLSPALHATRGHFASALRESGVSATSRARLQRLFVGAQIVFSQPLLLMIGVMLFAAIQEYRPMARPLAERMVRVSFAQLDDSSGVAERRTQLAEVQRRMLERAEVRAVLPQALGYDLRYASVPTQSRADSLLLLRILAAHPGWLAHVDTRITLGRDVAFADTNAADPAVVVGDRFARRIWGGASPLGRAIISTRSANGDKDTLRLVVVGVFEQPESVSEDDLIRIYTAHHARWREDYLMVRTNAPAEPLLPVLRQLARDAAPGVPLSAMETQAQHDDEERSVAVQVSMLAVGAGALALLLASLGLYGVVSLSVRQRTREIGIRLAVGAAPGRVARMFLASGMRIGVIALSIGLPVCVVALHFALARRAIIAPDLDPWRIGAGIAAVLMAVVALASWIPARRATRVDPASTLRVE